MARRWHALLWIAALVVPGCYLDWSKERDARIDARVDARGDLPRDQIVDAPPDLGTDLAVDAAPDQQVLLSNGAACPKDTVCRSGHCVDGVCCASASCAACRACNVGGSLGSCGDIPLGKDPNDDCPSDPVAGCGYDGTCDGAGACRKYASGTVCKAAQCSGVATLEPASTCDGKGSCVASSTKTCSPFNCDPASGTCYTSCTAANESTHCGFFRCNTGTGVCYSSCTTTNRATTCKAAAVCSGGICVGGLPLGTACNAGIQCQSGHCVDGLCCDSSCSGLCNACDLAGKLGFCSAVPAGQDPDGDCTQVDAPATCGYDGTCDGKGACRKYGASTQCAAASCQSGSLLAVPAKTCDGSGSCSGPAAVDCDPYRCDPGSAACHSTCTTANQATHCSWYQCEGSSGTCYSTCTTANQSTTCQIGAVCVAGACQPKLANGQGCTSSTQCLSGNCRDGVCCDTTCQAACYSCALAGKLGTCSAVPAGQDPGGDCPQDAVATCGKDGTCDGKGACRLYAAGTTCAAASCTDLTTLAPASTCDGKGSCQAQATTSCDPFACDPAALACFSSCTKFNQDTHCGWSQCNAVGGVCWASCTAKNEPQHCKSKIATCSGGVCVKK